jgi:predicted RNA-binding protein YlqC (UPF0109 family)
MDYIKLTERLIKALVIDEDAVSVKEFPSDDENKVEIQVMVAEDDMKRVIGKNGKIINSVSTILKASSSLHDHKYINLNFIFNLLFYHNIFLFIEINIILKIMYYN